MAIDPGVTTGWAIVSGRNDGASTVVTVENSGYTPWFEFALMFHDAMRDPERRFDDVVYETWRLYKTEALAQIGSDMPSSQCVGCIRLACELARRDGWRGKIRDQPASIKKVIDARMGGTDYLPKSPVEHDRDAIRHGYYWFLLNKASAK